MPCLQEGRTLLGHENCCVAGHWRTVAQQTSSQVGTMKPDGSVVLHRLNATEQAHARYAASQSLQVHNRISLRIRKRAAGYHVGTHLHARAQCDIWQPAPTVQTVGRCMRQKVGSRNADVGT